MRPLTFPTTLEAFIAYQERLISRPLTEDEREVTAVWLEIINQAEPESVQAADELIAQHPDHHRFLTAARAWMEAAQSD
jgi:LmbE family N-acetylglucosaminyl deacetylase